MNIYSFKSLPIGNELIIFNSISKPIKLSANFYLTIKSFYIELLRRDLITF